MRCSIVVNSNFFTGNGFNRKETVSILSEESAGEIKTSNGLKIIAPTLLGRNRVFSCWQEFRVAIEGIGQTNEEFVDLIIQVATVLLDDLVNRKQIKEEEKSKILDEIRETGIGFIPVYYDPMLYYYSTEQMKVLLTAA